MINAWDSVYPNRILLDRHRIKLAATALSVTVVTLGCVAEVATEAPGRYRRRHAARSDGVYRGCGR